MKSHGTESQFGLWRQKYAYHNLRNNYIIVEDLTELERILRTSWPHVTHGKSKESFVCG